MDSPGDWAERKVVVTGASGFVGAAVVQALLAHGATVIQTSRHPAQGAVTHTTASIGRRAVWVLGAIEDGAFVDALIGQHQPDVVFHLAAQPLVGVARAHPAATFETNIRGTWLLLDACRRLSPAARTVVASSDQAYGPQRSLPCTEDQALAGRDIYDVSKSCADLITTSFAHSYGLATGIARCSNIFGPGDLNFSRLIPGTMQAALRGQRPVIRSDGSPMRDYLFIDDMVRGYLLLAQGLQDPALRGQAYNFASGEPLSVLAMTRKALDAAGRPDLQPEVLSESAAEVQDKALSIAAAGRDLGWQALAGTDQRLRETAAWYRARLGVAAQPQAQAVEG